MNRLGTVVMATAGALAALLTVSALGYHRYGTFDRLLPEDIATRLVELHEPSCEPALVDRSDGDLAVHCRDGRELTFAALPSCDRSLACEVFDAFCWSEL
jgi:hypothetical protein